LRYVKLVWGLGGRKTFLPKFNSFNSTRLDLACTFSCPSTRRLDSLACTFSRLKLTAHALLFPLSLSASSSTPQYPEFYSFPPFFTIQPVLTTREKQMGLWRELILSYHSHQKIKVMRVHDCPLWKNADIGRELSPDDIQQVMEDFVKHGNGEWDDPQSKTRCRILWRKPEQLATDIYQWAEANGYINSICTVYELHSGEDVNGMSFEGADEELLRRALSLLENQGKCTVFKGDTSEDDGIKFF